MGSVWSYFSWVWVVAPKIYHGIWRRWNFGQQQWHVYCPGWKIREWREVKTGKNQIITPNKARVLIKTVGKKVLLKYISVLFDDDQAAVMWTSRNIIRCDIKFMYDFVIKCKTIYNAFFKLVYSLRHQSLIINITVDIAMLIIHGSTV